MKTKRVMTSKKIVVSNNMNQKAILIKIKITKIKMIYKIKLWEKQ